jgi:cytochrome oxidase Cu insertion factor (SCO1/SenC/PrrC family)
MMKKTLVALLITVGLLASLSSATSAPQTSDGAKLSTPLSVGSTAPDFTLTDQHGRKHSLAAEREKRPVVLVFYRGYW